MATQDKKTDKLNVPKKGEASTSKTNKRTDKVRLFSQVNVNVPIPRELAMILPSMALNSNDSSSPADESAADTLQAPTEAVPTSTQDGQSAAPSNTQQGAHHDRDIHIEETDSNDNLVTLTHSSSHHLSTKLHPVIHHITGGIPNKVGVNQPSIPHQTGNHSPMGSGTPQPPSPQQPQAPVTYVDETLQGKYGSLHVSKDGQYTFTLDPKSPAYILLQKQEPGTDTFTLHLSNGSKVIVQIPVQGHQDSPNISGDLTGTVTEDHQVDSNGLIATSGKIDVVDPDHDESSVQAETILGQFGTLTIDSKGHWQYQVDNSQSNIQALTSQTALHESFTIHTKDGTPQVLNMTIGGEDDNAVISGVDAGTVTEDQNTHAQGQLLVTDSDLGEDHFQASQVVGQFGTLTITKDGAWSYDLDNSNPKVQTLGQGATATETITVTSADGTQHQVTVTINGTNDRPVVSGASTGAVVEQGLNTSGTPDASGSLTATDVDTSDTITWMVNQPLGQFGTLSIDQQGHWHYQLDNSTGGAADRLAAGEHQSEAFWVTATDSAGASTPQKIVIDVQGSNDKPVVSAWTQLPAGKEDQPVMIKASDLLTHASDVDATDNLHVSNLQATHGHLVDNKDGTYTFTPDKDFNGEIRLTYDVVDGHGGSVSTQAKFDLTAAPDNAQISYAATDNHQGGVTEDHYYIDTHDNLHFNGKLDIVDPDKGEAQFDINLGPQTYQGIGYDTKLGGHVLIMQDGRYTYTIRDHQPLVQNLKQGETITDECVVRSQDGTQFTIKVNIHGTNDAPTLTAQTHSVTEDGVSLSGQIVGQDVDHGASLTYSIVNSVDGLTFNADGSYSFDPSHASYQSLAQGQTQTLTIPVTVTDEHGASATQNLEIVITGTNDAATVAGVDTGDVHENQAGQNMSPDYAQTGMSKISHDALTTSGQLSVVDPDTNEAIFDTKGGVYSYHGQYGHLLLRGDGHWEYAVAAGQTDWQQKGASTTVGSTIDKLGTGETLTDTITIQTKDGTNHDIVVTIHGDNDAPYVSGEVQLHSGKEDLPQTLTQTELLTNSIDVDHNDIGKLSVANLHADHGSILDNKDGTYTFTPDKNYNGQVHFTYDVKDAHGGTTHTGANTTLVATSDKAIISEVTTGSVIEDGPHATHSNGTTTELASGQLRVIDPDNGEDKFQYSQFGETRIHDPFGGILRIDSAGSWGYSVDNTALQHLAQGQVETVTYRVHSFDGTAYDLHIDVIGTNDAPTATKVVLSNGTEDTHYQMQASQFGFTDVDTGDTLHSIAITDLPPATQGKFVLDGHDITAGQSIATADIAKLQFVPATDFNGDVQFKFTVNDGHVDSQEVTNTLHIDAVGDAATISGRDTGDVHEGHTYTAPDGTMSGGYVDDRSPDHMHGNVGKIWNDEIHTDGHLDIVDPDAGENHAQTGTYQGTLGHVILQSNGDWSYYASIGQDATGRRIDRLGQGESITDTVTVKSADGTTHDIHITIHGDNDRPYCSSEVQLNSGKEDLAQTITTTELLANTVDVDANDAGQLSIANLRADHGTLVDNKDGTFTFTPEHNFNGQVHFTYDVKDAHGGTTHTGANVVLTPTGDAAKFSGTDAGSLTEDLHVQGDAQHTIYTTGVLDVTDPDSGEDHFRATRNAHALHDPYGGTLTIGTAGDWSYSVPNGNVQHLAQGESKQVQYEVQSAGGDKHVITLTIHGTNDVPVVTSAVTLAQGTEDTPVVLKASDLLANATDVDDNSHLSVHNLSADHGQIVDNHDGTFSFTPDKDYNGQVQFRYDVQDEHGASVTTSASMSLAAVNDAATFAGDFGSITEDANVQHNVYLTGTSPTQNALQCTGHLVVSDLDGQSESALDLQGQRFLTHDGTYGHFIVSAKGTWAYVADNDNQQLQDLDNGQTLTDSVEVTSKDGTKHSITVTINGTTDKPVLHSLSDSGIQHSGPIEGNLLSGIGTHEGVSGAATDTDSNAHLVLQDIQIQDPNAGYVTVTPGHPHSIAGVGTLAIEANGHYTFTPEAGFTGMVPAMVYRVGDDGGGSRGDSSQNRLTIEVTPPAQHAPTATPQTVSSDEDQTHTFTTSEFGYSDADGDALSHITITQLPAHGTLMLNGILVTTNQQISKADLDAGHLTFTPIHDQNGANYANIGFTANDGHQDSANVTMVLNVNAINDAPTVQEKTQTGQPLGSHSITEDSNVDSTGQIAIHDVDGDQLSVAVDPMHNAQFGQVQFDSHTNTWTYHLNNTNPRVDALNDGDTLQDTFTLVVDDGHGGQTRQQITMTINGHTDPVPYTPPTLNVNVDTQHAHHITPSITAATVQAYAHNIGQFAHRVSGRDEIEGHGNSEVFIVQGSLHEEAELKGGNDILFIGGRLTDEEIEGGSGTDTLILGAYTRQNAPRLHDHGEKLGNMELESIENIILGDGTVLKGHMPANFPVSSHGHYETAVDISARLSSPDESVTDIRLTHLQSGVTLQSNGHPINANPDGSYSVPASGHITLVSDQPINGNHHYFETEVTTHNSVTGVTGVTTEDRQGQLHSHITPPPPPPPPTMSQSDEVADADTLDVEITLSSDIDHYGNDDQHHVDPHLVSQTTQTDSDEPQHGAAAYLSALGIEPTQAVVDAPVHAALPDDIDLVLADDMSSADSSHLGLDDAATGAMQEASDHAHQHEERINPDEHHDQGDPSSFIDPY
ncbi:tandem-95 repeat protein [Vibrio sp. RE86]|uniref:VCBS domain-containing protein n=1 Tax=Vibrio sp. RE86 TaxID=2607605 RepID=UPI00149355C3|nr:VCBS domain-containing protein [Vibrio sp. RE86]NOH78647.1 tandem-95 repeat protein [Vibrio sp. RE86]